MEEIGEEEAFDLWGVQREVFRNWLGDLTNAQLMEIGKEVYMAIEFRTKKDENGKDNPQCL